VQKIFRERMNPPRQGLKMNLDLGRFEEAMCAMPREGTVIFDLRDSRTGAVISHWEKKNIITLDAGIIAARLFANSQVPVPGRANGLIMLAVGTGATGNLLNPDAPQATQRTLNNEIQRKAFVSIQYRNASGIAVSYPTNIVDFTTTFAESEAVGALNEMALMSTYSSNPAVQNLVPGSGSYDPTVDVTNCDLIANYLTFGVITKPSLSVLTITWRVTF
jgi:hypothetical protein